MHPELDVLLQYADGELDAAESQKVDKHLDECAECRLEVARLRHSTVCEPPSPVAAEMLLAGIRDWTVNAPRPEGNDLKQRVAGAINTYLGSDATAVLLHRVSDQNNDLLSAIEPVLADFLGRRAAAKLIDRTVDHIIMRR